MRRLVGLGAASLLLACGGGERSSTAATGEAKESTMTAKAAPDITRRAVLIGIGTYPAQRDSLPGPTADVEEMRAVLISQFGFHRDEITTLVDRQGTRQNIIAAIRSALRGAGATGSVFLYFSGHGLHLSQNYGEQDAETDGVDEALLVWDVSGKATMILDDELGVLMRELPASHRVAIIDACFSGGVISFSTLSKDHAMILRSRGEDTLEAPALTKALFVRKSQSLSAGDPGFVLPTQFLKDAHTGPSADLDDLDVNVLVSSAGDAEKAYGGRDWPRQGESHSVFTHTLTRLLPTLGTSVSFERVLEATKSAIDTTRGCVVEKKCQTPKVLGRDRQLSLEEVIGTIRR